jgi:MFS family permease
MRNNSRKNLWLIYFNIVLYATCFQIQKPLEPFLVTKLQGDNNEYAKIQSFYSFLQMIGSLICGKLFDSVGIKGGFLICFGFSGLGYFFLAQATTLNMLYLSKVPCIFQSAFLCAQTAVSHMTEDGSGRVKALGLLTFCYTVGSVIGPSLGGFLGASGDYYLGAKLAVGGSVLSMLLTLFMDSNAVEAHSAGRTSGDAEVIKKSSSFISTYCLLFGSVWMLLTTRVISSTANSMALSVFPVVLKDNFGLHERGVGLSMSGMSVCNGIVSGFLLEHIIHLLGGKLLGVIYICIYFMTGLFIFQGVLNLPNFHILTPHYSLFLYLPVAYILSAFQFILATTVTGESLGRISSDTKGTLLGMQHSLFAAARVITPQLGVVILSKYGISGVSFACSIIYGIVLFLWNVFDSKNSLQRKIGGRKDL